MTYPNPGSPEAYKIGCTCPRLDNNNGKRAPFPGNGWYIRDNCPVHNYNPKDAA